jgi:hypothetical protein
MKTLYVIHHSHTDVGYTARQSTVERWHADFIRQALEIVEAGRRRQGEHFSGFRWVCETFWSVEQFLARATDVDRDALARAVRNGSIGLSASYLNLSELAGFELLSRITRRAVEYGRSIGAPVKSAMTADVNGHGWGFARALADAGVENLFTCVHTHHGMYPLGRKPAPFYWEAPDGRRVLVWNGEHYHLGNELGLVPGAVSSYLTKDECDAEMIFHDHWSVSEIRIPRYFEALEREGYPYDFAPVMASGLRSDNAPPSPAIIDTIERWNRAHGANVRIEMVTLSQFFERLRGEPAEIPVHRGDWPDWWSDGPSGNPTSTMLFRVAQRGFEDLLALSERYPRIGAPDPIALENDLALYAEHTFSHAHAMSDPWHPVVHAIAERKRAYAARAADAVAGLLHDALGRLGAAALAANTPCRYEIINPLDHRVSGTAGLAVGHHEFNELRFDRGARVRDEDTAEPVPCQLTRAPLGGEFRVHVELAAGEGRVLAIEAADGTGLERASKEEPAEAAEADSGAVDSAAGPRSEAAEAGALETPFVRIAWEPGDGIVEWRDLRSDAGLIRADRRDAPLTPVHEVTPLAGRDDVCATRARMGLNRKGQGVVRTAGRLTACGGVETGAVFAGVTLGYDVPGMSVCEVELRALVDEPRVDVAVRMHKESTWAPENVYVSLPFAPDGRGVLWLDKAGAPMRPRFDQIPGTLTDYYAVQGGFAVVGAENGVGVAMLDNHLLQLGPLEHGERLLAGDPALGDDPAHAYAWLMTNYWETNFSAGLGGFYEFRYSIMWGPELGDRDRALRRVQDACRGITCFRLRDAS